MSNPYPHLCPYASAVDGGLPCQCEPILETEDRVLEETTIDDEAVEVSESVTIKASYVISKFFNNHADAYAWLARIKEKSRK